MNLIKNIHYEQRWISFIWVTGRIFCNIIRHTCILLLKPELLKAAMYIWRKLSIFLKLKKYLFLLNFHHKGKRWKELDLFTSSSSWFTGLMSIKLYFEFEKLKRKMNDWRYIWDWCYIECEKIFDLNFISF